MRTDARGAAHVDAEFDGVPFAGAGKVGDDAAPRTSCARSRVSRPRPVIATTSSISGVMVDSTSTA